MHPAASPGGDTSVTRVPGSRCTQPHHQGIARVQGLAGGAVREGLRRADFIRVDDRILDPAEILEPRVLRTLDAIHLATALAAGDDLEAIVTYDGRMAEGARGGHATGDAPP